MNIKLIKLTSVVAIAGAAVMGLSACSNTDTSSVKDIPATESPLASAPAVQNKPAQQTVLEPVTRAIAELKEAQLTAVVGQGINISVPEDQISNWQATFSDPNIMIFTPGGASGQSVSNPGLTAKAAGKTDVTLTNAATGETVKFSVVVA